jgi:hypothetical protein
MGVHSEQELSFQGKDRYRLSGSNAAAAGAVLVAELAFSESRMGFVGFCWMLGGTVALIGLGIVPLRRSRTAVGAEGISVSWGFGRGRTYRWADIRWVEVHETRSRNGTAQSLRITLADSRRRSLPALQNSAMYPDPEFDLNVARIKSRWRANTAEASRFKPPEKWRQRRSPTTWGYLIGVAIMVAVVLGVLITT